MIPVVLHIPHSGTVIPDDLRPDFAIPPEEIERELLLMTDWHTERLFRNALPGAEAVVFPVSRLVVDPERFPDDAREPMAALGMGAVYHSRQDGTPLLRPGLPAERREAVMRRFYQPHHAALAAAVGRALEGRGRCLVIDGHSFPSRPLPYEDSARRRPEICLGTDPFHTPPALAAAARTAFKAEGFETAFDEPFAGALVPEASYGRDARVVALMIELRRDLYMDEASGRLGDEGPGFEKRLGRALRGMLGLAGIP